MFVGVGASRVRDLFKEAAKVAPCIIFIDEIDTIGKTRDSRFGGNDEREQTLNQLLAELDGFDPSKGVIVLGATNRPEVLDKALLRPGRFDRRITVDRPNLAGRLATLQVHTRNIQLAEDVNLEKIAQATAGCVGADLANLVNEAALRAVRKGRKAVNQNDLLVSFELVIAGSEKKGTVITEQEKRIIAYHEVGHALVAAKQKNAQPVSKITIVPHTQGALGYTLHLPEEEKFLMSREDILAEIRTLLAGRSSEEVVCNTMTSGAANDIERATEMARNLVARFGMCDEFDMVALGTVQSQYLDGGYSMTCAQETYAAADRETIKIIRQCHKEAKEILHGEPGAAGQDRRVPAEEGDHHRSGDDGHYRGPRPRDRGQLRRHTGAGAAPVPSQRAGDHRGARQAHQHRLPAHPHAGLRREAGGGKGGRSAGEYLRGRIHGG